MLRYEDLARDNAAFMVRLLDELRIPVTPQELDRLGARYSFEAQAEGRSQGTEDIHHHLRKGIAGDWQNHLDGDLLDHFMAVAGSNIGLMGYD